MDCVRLLFRESSPLVARLESWKLPSWLQPCLDRIIIRHTDTQVVWWCRLLRSRRDIQKFFLTTFLKVVKYPTFGIILSLHFSTRSTYSHFRKLHIKQLSIPLSPWYVSRAPWSSLRIYPAPLSGSRFRRR